MPQMSPLSWLTLFISFNSILLACLAKIWFTKPNMIFSEKSNIKLQNNFESMTWKW